MSQTILIIDDFASVRLYHASFLTRKGYRCLEAVGGTEALDLLRGNHVDLILLDMVMPGMDGNAFVAQLAGKPAWAALPVLLITSEESLARDLLSDRSRPISVLCKPVMPAALLEGVRRLLPMAPNVAPLPTAI